MAVQVKPVTPYSIPFSVSIQQPPLLVGKAGVLLRVSLKNTANQNSMDNLNSLVTPFVMLASIGALCGDTVNPVDSDLIMTDNPKIITPHTIEWIFNECNMDERALVILVHFLLTAHDEDPITEVAIVRQNSMGKLAPLASDPKMFDPYPPIWPDLPFALDINKDFYENFTVIATFKQNIKQDDAATIEGELLTWATAVAMGAYGVAPVSPERCSMLLDESILVFDNEIEWGIIRFRGHPSAIHGLINAFVVIHHNIAPMLEVIVE
ncbi:MAG: hypothetical protein GY737_06055 [Desulfobacteraceae bacterium]|nr:hypothetical protein [Desulfobacteraceae bacterium]